MSFNVMVLCEDIRKDTSILKPVVEKVLSEADRPKAVVRMCPKPIFGGYGALLSYDRITQQVFQRYTREDLYLLIADRDGENGRETAVARLQERLQTFLDKSTGRRRHVICELARQEAEILPLAGHPKCKAWPWPEVRNDPHVKESRFLPLARELRVHRHPDGGRGVIMSAAMKNWSRIKSRCPEETVGLAAKIKAL